jgi:hypothetical protein
VFHLLRVYKENLLGHHFSVLTVYPEYHLHADVPERGYNALLELPKGLVGKLQVEAEFPAF